MTERTPHAAANLWIYASLRKKKAFSETANSMLPRSKKQCCQPQRKEKRPSSKMRKAASVAKWLMIPLWLLLFINGTGNLRKLQQFPVYERDGMATDLSVLKNTPTTKGDEGVYLITGVAGYIGSHMALALLERGERVVGIDNMSRGSERALKVLREFELFHFEWLDLGNPEDVDKLFASRTFHTVIHFAGLAFPKESVEKPDLYKLNIASNTWRLVDTMIKYGVPTMVYSSTCAVYGVPDTFPITEETPANPISPYGQSKLDAERYIQYKSSPSFNAKVLRYFNVVGSDSKGRLRENPLASLASYARLWTACLDVAFKRRTCVTLQDIGLGTSPDGTSIRDYIHVEDVVNAHLEVLNLGSNQKPFQVYNVATNRPTSTMEFIEAARQVTGVFIPICFAKTQSQSDPPRLFASGESLRARTGWTPRYTNIRDMLETAWKTQDASKVNDWASEHYDVCIVGAGLSASVLAERHVASYNHSVLVMDKRDHIGGNCYDYIDKETNIRVSKYGVHLFHTKYERVWEYIQRFSSWTPWEHRCLAKVGTKHIPVPVNIDSVNALFDMSISSEEEMKEFLKKEQILPPNGNATNSEEVALSRVGRRLYDLIFRPYTIKQWNKEPADLGPSVLARIPVRTNHDDRYFTDKYQALPSNGYTRIFENMLNSPRITVKLNTNYFEVRNTLSCGHTYFTGPIDAYFAAKGLPKLEYRSLTFERKVYRNTESYQPKAHVNYPAMSYNYTRAIEYKHLLHQTSPHTVVFFERSSDTGEPYYPVPNKENLDLYARYQEMAVQEPNVTFVGRLANYKYFNMDQTILNALELFDSGSGHFPRSCQPGNFTSIQQWKSLFPKGNDGLGLGKEKALIFIPVGKHSAEYIDALVRGLGTDIFHFFLLRYDSYDWSSMAWFDNVEWADQPPNNGTNWAMAKRFLVPSKVSSFSHVCVWDDDLVPTEYFDGAVFLQWLQQLDLGIVQPMIRKNCHRSEGTCFHQRPKGTQVHEVEKVEIMAPCYSTKVWSSCIWPRIRPEYSTGWGIDTSVHRATCAPPSVHSLSLLLDHKDSNSLVKSSGGRENAAYRKQAEIEKWGRRSYPRPLGDFRVAVDKECRVTMQS